MGKQEKIGFLDNSFDYLRMFSAITIIIGHCIIHFNIQLPSVIKGTLNSWVGLICLFTLTGYLIPASYERSKSKVEFIKKRFIRLYPGLIGAFILSLICVLIIGGWDGLRYSLVDLAKWSVAQLTFAQFYTPDSISRYGVGNPNGALWTISMEIQVYLAVLVTWDWLRKRGKHTWEILIFTAMLINVAFPYIETVIPHGLYKLLNVTFIPYGYVFLLGMFLYRYRETFIPSLVNAFWIFALLLCCWSVLNETLIHISFGHYTNIITGVLISLFTISFGYKLGKHKVKNELSYGLYIYHMIVINALVMLNISNTAICTLLTVCVTYLLAYLSDKYIEKPCVKRLK